MAATPGAQLWLEVLTVTGVGTAAIVGAAWLVSRGTRGARRRRALWQVTTAALAALVLGELTGLGPLIAHLVRSSEREHAGVAEPALPREQPDAPSEEAVSSDRTAGAISETALPPTARLERRGVPPGPPSPAGTSDSIAVQPDVREALDVALRAADAERAGTDGPSIATRSVDGRGGTNVAVWWPGFAWASGALVLLARSIVAWTLLLLLHRRRAEDPASPLSARVRALAGRLHFGRPVRVIRIRGLSGPFATGIFRPAVGVPENFEADHDTAEQDAMLLHELGHLAGHDPSWHAVSDLVTIALWWHPMAWWARHELRATDEFTADETSLLLEGGPDALAASLVKLGGRMVAARSGLGGLARAEGSGFRSGLGRRVERLLNLPRITFRPVDPPPGGFRRWFVQTTLRAVMVAALVSSTLWLRPLSSKTDLSRFRDTTREGDSTMPSPLLPFWKRSLAGLTILAVLGADTDTAAQETGDVPVLDLSNARRSEQQADPSPVDAGVENTRPRDERETQRLQNRPSDRQVQNPQRVHQAARPLGDGLLGGSLNPAQTRYQAIDAPDRVKMLEDQVRQLQAQVKRLADQLTANRQAESKPRDAYTQIQQRRSSAFAAENLASGNLRTEGSDLGSFGFSRATDGGSQSDLIGLATKLADAMGDARIARLRHARVSELAGRDLVSRDELDVAAINLETAEQKIQLLREIARAYLRRARSEIVVLRGELSRLRKQGDAIRRSSLESRLDAAEAIYSVLDSLSSLEEPGRASSSRRNGGSAR